MVCLSPIIYAKNFHATSAFRTVSPSMLYRATKKITRQHIAKKKSGWKIVSVSNEYFHCVPLYTRAIYIPGVVMICGVYQMYSIVGIVGIVGRVFRNFRLQRAHRVVWSIQYISIGADRISSWMGEEKNRHSSSHYVGTRVARDDDDDANFEIATILYIAMRCTQTEAYWMQPLFSVSVLHRTSSN